MNSLHINYWTHLNVDLTSAHLNTLPCQTHFFKKKHAKRLFTYIFIPFQMTLSVRRKKEIRIMWANKLYYAAKEFE